MKANIIFVDDEENILKGLRRSLHPARDEWSMNFVSSGKEALDLMKTKKYDVIISDMRMPHMNGVELLSRVKELYPYTLRIILSGYSETELILNCVKVAHQYLPKPSNFNTIKSTVDTALRLSASFQNEKLQKTVSKIESLPTLPRIYDEINEELRKEDADLKKVSALISSDISLTAKLLQICNSAFFGLNRTVDSPDEAVNYLGIDTVKSLVLSIKIFEQFSENDSKNSDLEKIWAQSQKVASLAKKISKYENCEKTVVNQSYTGGLLHKIGEIIFRQECPNQFRAVIEICANENIDQIEGEHKVFGFDQNIVGAFLLDIWGLPVTISNSLALQQQPQNLDFDNFGAAEIVYVAKKTMQHDEGLLDPKDAFFTSFKKDRIDNWKSLIVN